MNIAIASDHAGFQYKETVKEYLESKGHTVHDFGTDSTTPVDYPLYVRPAAEAVARGDFERGIVFGGTGNGEAMVANKVHGILCAVCWSRGSAWLARAHNNANMMALGERMIPEQELISIVETWLAAPFEGGRHQRRVELVAEMDVA